MFTTAVVFSCEVESVLPVTVPPVIYKIAPVPELRTAAGSSVFPVSRTQPFIVTPSLIFTTAPESADLTTAAPPLLPAFFLKFCIVVPLSIVTVALDATIAPGA